MPIMVGEAPDSGPELIDPKSVSNVRHRVSQQVDHRHLG
jgi:hypothetical protein